MLNHLDLFSGIGGFTLAAQQTGRYKTIAFCEKDKYCRQVLKEHFDAGIIHDIRYINGKDFRGIDIITGGFPCQDLSTAGARAGLSGERSGLWFEFARIINEAMPKWVLIENVPGLLTSQQGRDFQIILNQMAEFGYCVAWRTLDAQFFGVPQRRRRVFIVCSLGNASAGEVLFDTESNARYTETVETKEHQTTGTFGENTYSFDSRNNSVSYAATQTLQSKSTGGWSLNYMPIIGRYWDGGDISDTLDTSMLMKGQMMPEKRRFPVVYDFSHANDPAREYENISPTLRPYTGGNSVHSVRNPVPLYYTHDYNHQRIYSTNGISPALATDKEWKFLVDERLRRLTPKECERLMGFPDDWTNCGISDTQRYKQLGNSIAVPVVKQIMERIANVEFRGQ